MANSANDLDLLEIFLKKNRSVKYIRLQWVDYSSIQHAQVAPVRTCKKLASGVMDHLSLAENCMIIPISTAPQSFTKQPEAWELRPDWSSLLLCGFAKKHATVMCCMFQRGAEDPTANCPRTLLSKVLQKYEAKHMSTILVGFEAEFVLLDENLTQPIQPLDPVPGDSTMAGLRGHLLNVLEEMVEAIEDAGIPVQNFHTEGVNHFEIAFDPKTPMAGIDALMHAHETIRTIAVQHGLKATFAVQPTLTGALNARNGSHVHISLSSPTEGDGFLAGILNKTMSLCAIGLANFDSYVRIGIEGTGAWIGYGTENRNLPIRKIADGHWELRCVDATANMYLFMATMLSAGSAGITENKSLVWKDLPKYPHDLTPDELAQYGVVNKMPTTLRASVDALRNDQEMRQWMGDVMFNQYLDIKDVEINTWVHMSHVDRTHKFVKFF